MSRFGFPSRVVGEFDDVEDSWNDGPNVVFHVHVPSACTKRNSYRPTAGLLHTNDEGNRGEGPNQCANHRDAVKVSLYNG